MNIIEKRGDTWVTVMETGCRPSTQAEIEFHAQVEALRAAIVRHRRDSWGEHRVRNSDDERLYQAASSDTTNASGPAHLAPQPALGLAFDSRGVLGPIDEAASSGGEEE